MKQLFLIISTFFVMQAQAQQTNYHFSHTDSTQATSDKIWAVWTDVPNWKQWDKGLKEATLEGDFIVGTKGKLIPDKGPKSKFVISEVVPNQSYTFKTKIPFGWLIIKRSLEVKEGKTFFTHDVEFTGLLKKILGKRLGVNYKKMLPDVMADIKKIAESK
ncbi:SRPBCC family protein [Thermoflexibacter ruber]|uniref:Polyketide cyclase / dehydrase and lipid transport n=1 Tax=Thermoflexibacter ruber TaxID=1003 RepID=A0A1I2JXT0_9BACT|nr:polyketide cyclase [Thermoflexibacter ruber]SFF59635.1 Polyketide cyclase / dehydrase and lipid transport [Thermoflexibacter ruber]